MSSSAAPTRLAKAQRQHLVAKLLAGHAVHSQEQLVALLAEEGVAATQATVSRDLDDLGAVRVRIAGGEATYAVPELTKHPVLPEELVRRAFADHVVEVAHSANLVVLRTPPGTANVVAAALDRSGRPEIVGTVAGDDTILVIVGEGTPGSTAADWYRELAGLT
ncbi:MAG: arginine repressor [Acidimicrobiales bacterium]